MTPKLDAYMTPNLYTCKNLIGLEAKIYKFNLPHLKCLLMQNCELWFLLETIHAWSQQVYLEMDSLVWSPDSSGSNTVVSAKIKAGVDRVWELLNTGTWKDVPECIKHIYTLLCYYKLIATLISISVPDWSLKLTEECIHVLDRGILLGYNNPHISNAMQYLMEMYNSMDKSSERDLGNEDTMSERKPTSSCVVMSSWTITGVRGAPIEEARCPSLLRFHADYLLVRRPVKLRDCVSHWPALSKWDLAYFRHLAGPRLVPVEVGKKYTDEDWSQRLMSLNEFLDQHMSEHSHAYLAQHDLLSQIPQLKQDIVVPDYCYLHTDGDNVEKEAVGDDYVHTDGSEDRSRDVDLNMWFGPPGTVTPFHWDVKHNLLVQVLGRKRVLLARPDCAMYPYEGLLNNTSRVDPEADPELLTREFPDFVSHPVLECTLDPGEVLYIPPGVWHHVRSLSTSISVSFWF